MSKANDRVEWAFIDAMMERLAFGATWRHLIMDCISTPVFSFVINGNPKGGLFNREVFVMAALSPPTCLYFVRRGFPRY